MARVVVVGAGVTGLTCAVRLLEDGHRVDVLARDLPLETVSAVAAALWYPYLAQPVDRVTTWGRATYDAFGRLAADDRTGVALKRGTEVLGREQATPPWAAGLDSFAVVRRADAERPFGWTFVAPVIDMPVYLRWLQSRVEDLGGTLTRMALTSLPQLDGVVVNAAGLGARVTAGDREVRPVRGQVVRLEQTGLDQWWLDGTGPTYVVPRRRDIVVGGTEEYDAWDRRPDPEVAARILERARALVPELAGARVLGHRVGLRPARPSVRLETEQFGDTRVVHCYGHGGAGVTLSWGCADEVAALVSDGAATPATAEGPRETG